MRRGSCYCMRRVFVMDICHMKYVYWKDGAIVSLMVDMRHVPRQFTSFLPRRHIHSWGIITRLYSTESPFARRKTQTEWMAISVEVRSESLFLRLYQAIVSLNHGTVADGYICKRYSFECGIGKYSTRPRNKVWAFRRTPYSLDMCCIFPYRTKMKTVCIFSHDCRKLSAAQISVQLTDMT